MDDDNGNLRELSSTFDHTLVDLLRVALDRKSLRTII